MTDKNYEVCKEASDEKHEADPLTFYLSADGEGVYLDINCKHCGQSGCIGRFDVEKVDWG